MLKGKSMFRRCKATGLAAFIAAVVCGVSDFASAGKVIKGVQAEGACAIVGMSAEQSQLTALQRARTASVKVFSAPLETNYVLVVLEK
jgi:hypothetical protein